MSVWRAFCVYALSLNDVLGEEESETLCWDEVSLYRNEFDALIAQAAFSGIISEEALSSTSPEFGTDGYYAKCWVREADGILSATKRQRYL